MVKRKATIQNRDNCISLHSSILLSVFLILSFFILQATLFPTVVRAEVTCPDGGFVYDKTLPEEWQCCNYQNSPNHISSDDPDCNSTHCKMENFAKNPDSNTYGGVCRYCNTNVTVRIDGCSGCGCTCNQVCAAGDDDEDDGPPADFCPVPDYDTDPCCPIEFPLSNLPGWLKDIFDTLTKPLDIFFKAAVKLKENKLEHAHVKGLTEDYLGTHIQNYNDGVMTKFMPPNHIFMEKPEKERVRDTWAKLEVDVGSEEGEEEEKQIIEGADWYPYKLDYATTFLADALTRIPGQEDSQISLLREEAECEPVVIKLASLPAIGVVLAATDDELCHDILPGPKHSACVAEETGSAEISFTQALENILSGKIKIYPRLSFLDKIYDQTIGPSGFFRIFDIPGEEHEEYDGEAESDLEITISVLGHSIPFSVSSGGKGIFHTGTEKVGHDNILQKLSPPGGEY